MAMKWMVKEIAELRGIMNARALGRLADVPPTSIYQIWSGEAKRVDLETLNKLCTALRVPLALLLEHVPEAVEPLPGSEAAQGEGVKTRRTSSSSKPKGSAKQSRAAAIGG
jgi:DNA-binding Xre family transcriptional regulator